MFDFSSITIELTFVTLGHGFKKAGSVIFDIGNAWEKDFLNPITSVCICVTVVYSFSKYSHSYYTMVRV